MLTQQTHRIVCLSPDWYVADQLEGPPRGTVETFRSVGVTPSARNTEVAVLLMLETECHYSKNVDLGLRKFRDGIITDSLAEHTTHTTAKLLCRALSRSSAAKQL
jgi:hypothetical protein